VKTLFLNPNSSHAITETLKRQIASHSCLPSDYEVRQLDGAPLIIGSMNDNEQAQALLEKHFRELTTGLQRLVIMSSLDTGFEAARRLGGIEVHGFTRSVLAWSRLRSQQLQAITFDPSMTHLYRALFGAKETEGIVKHINVLPLAPADVGQAREAVLGALRGMCAKLSDSCSSPIFIVGAVGLEFGQLLRQEGFRQVIDPIADLMAFLRSTDRT
jgi:Asp/Glu/hydantoin racemase